MSHFAASEAGVEVRLTKEEKTFLADVLPLLAGIGEVWSDPAATRLNVPVYLDDSQANDEWWRLMGEDLREGRRQDRGVLARVVQADDHLVLTESEADAFLRVVNEARLALGARMGLDVEEDLEHLSDEKRGVLDYLGWILEELTVELSRSL